MQNVSFKVVATVLAIFGVGLLIANFGTAHPVLLDDIAETLPNPGQVLEVSPNAIELFFDERSLHGGMNAELSTFFVVKLPASSVVAVGTMDLDNEFRDSMKAVLDEPLEEGEYVVRWVGVSNADNGYTEGVFNFFVGSNPDGIGTRNESGTAVGGVGGEAHGHGEGEEEGDSHNEGEEESHGEGEEEGGSHNEGEEESHGEGEEGDSHDDEGDGNN